MRAAFYNRQGDLNALEIGELPDPTPDEDEVLIRVRAAAFNGFDPMMVMGTTSLKTPLPMIPCGDLAGEIVDHGPNVDAGVWPVGQRVTAYPIIGSKVLGETMRGAAAELIVVPAANLLPVPDNVSDVAAAALPIAYGTAYRMLFKRGGLKSGETLVVLGASGGVGIACVQLGKSIGATVIALATGAAKCEKLRETGADHAIDLKSQDMTDSVRDIVGRPRVNGDGGADMVVNFVGGQTFGESARLLGKDGRLMVCGASAGYDVGLDARYLWSFEHRYIGSDGWSIEDQRALLAMVDDGRLDPLVHAVRPLEEAGNALKELSERLVVGKSLLQIGTA